MRCARVHALYWQALIGGGSLGGRGGLEAFHVAAYKYSSGSTCLSRRTRYEHARRGRESAREMARIGYEHARPASSTCLSRRIPTTIYEPYTFSSRRTREQGRGRDREGERGRGGRGGRGGERRERRERRERSQSERQLRHPRHRHPLRVARGRGREGEGGRGRER